jgi:ketosteroid isomerase-like protein
MRDVVVTPVHSGPPRRSRNLEERIWLRFPAAYRCLALVLSRLSPRSRLRRVLLRRGLVSGWAAFNRRDFEFRRVMFAPDVESEFAHDEQALGLSGLRGHAAMDQALSELTGVWDFELEPAYIFDFCDRVLFLGFNRGRARTSGVSLEQEYAQLVTTREGLVTRDESWFRWDEGLRAAGLDPDVVALPKRRKAGQVASSSFR